MSYFDRPQRPKRRNFGLTWWGNEWVAAIESNASIDANRLPRGRTYARWGYVGELKVEPGLVFAEVEGSEPSPYRTSVRVAVLDDEQWESLFDVVASKVAHAASLIDGELTSELVDDAAAIGVELLPTHGQISTNCSCPDQASPCKHAAAVCYLVADLLDDNPFELLALRGRSQEQVEAALKERRRGRVGDQPPTNQVETWPAPGPLPRLGRSVAHPGEEIAIDADFARAVGLDPAELAALARAASRRAWEIYNGMGDTGLRASPYLDLVRHGAGLWGTPEFKKLCHRTSIDPATLAHDVEQYVSDKALS